MTKRADMQDFHLVYLLFLFPLTEIDVKIRLI